MIEGQKRVRTWKCYSVTTDIGGTDNIDGYFQSAPDAAMAWANAFGKYYSAGFGNENWRTALIITEMVDKTEGTSYGILSWTKDRPHIYQLSTKEASHE